MLRRATMHDARKLDAVHVASWKETYAGILPKDMLAGLSIEARSAAFGASQLAADSRARQGKHAVLVTPDQAHRYVDMSIGLGCCFPAGSLS